jgi:hypothetical protein
MSIAIIRRGGAHNTRINHEKRHNQRELDVHGQWKCRRQDILFTTPYRHFAPIGGDLEKNWLDLFSLFVNIPLKRNLNAVKRHVLLQYVIFCQQVRTYGSVCGEKRSCRPKIEFGRTATIAIMFCRKKEINARVRNFKTHHRNQERPG